MTRPLLLDLFCGAGGATRGYQRAGFKVVGVDIAPQPHYCGDYFVQADVIDALRTLAGGGLFDGRWWGSSFKVVHASPPCQRFSDLAKRNRNAGDWPDLIEPVRESLRWFAYAFGTRWVIENVEGAPLRNPVSTACG